MSVYDLMPYELIKEDKLYLKDNSIAKLLKIRSKGRYETETMSGRAIVANDIMAMLNNVPPFTNIQLIYDIHKAKQETGQTEEVSNDVLKMIQKNRNKVLEKEYLECDTYMAINLRPSAKTAKISPTVHISGTGKKKEDATSPEMPERDLDNIIENIKNILAGNKIEAEVLKGQELLQTVAAMINNVTPTMYKEYEFTLTGLATNYELCQKEINFDRKELKNGSEYIGVVSLSRLPEFTQPFNRHPKNYAVPMLHPLLHGLEFPHRVVVNVTTCDKEKEINKLKRDMNINRAMKDDKSKVKVAEGEVLIEEITAEHKELSYIGVKVIISDPDKKELNDKCNKTLMAYNRVMAATGYVEQIDSLPLFVASLPGVGRHDYRSYLLKNENVADMINIFDYYKGAASGVKVLNRLNQPILLDTWAKELDNKNGIIIGPSGSGKSYTMNALLTQEAERGAKLFIIDKRASYKKLIQIIGGTYYDFQLDNPIPINPFYLHTGELKYQKINFLIRFISALVKEPAQSVEELDKTLVSIIESTIIELYEKNKTPILTDFYELFKTKNNTYYDITKNIKNLESYLSRHLYREYFNNPDTINLGSIDYIYFDLFGLDEDKELQSLVAMNLIDILWAYIEQHKDTFKRVVIDEAWDLMKNKELGLMNTVFMLYRTLRKMNGGIWTISQSALDYDDPEIQSAISENVSTLIIMQQSDKTIKNTREVFDLTDEQLMILRSVKKSRDYNEAFIQMEGMTTVVRIKESKHGHYVFTTDPAENNKLYAKIEEFGGVNNRLAVIKAIRHMVKEAT